MEKIERGQPASPSQMDSPFLKALAGGVISPPPIWLMRQAGRYLPEYRQVRKKAGEFLDLCYTPSLAAEVTLQPIRRFGLDAAILFSDILVVADALGQRLWFEEGAGPRLEPVSDSEGLSRLDRNRTTEKFELVCETVSRVRAELPDETALIGFCGGPWTVATYMVAGRATSDQAPARLWAYRDSGGFGRLIDLLTDVSIEYLSGQISAGAQAVQIFESWAGVLPEGEFERWVIRPNQKLVSAIRQRHPGVPVIGFPRTAGPLYSKFVRETGVDGVGCDTSLPLDWMAANLQPLVTVQGNLDPLALVVGGERLREQARAIVNALGAGPHIFNLGHGVVPQTPPEHVEQLVRYVREG